MTKKINPQHKPRARKNTIIKPGSFPAEIKHQFLSGLHMTDHMIAMFADNMLKFFNDNQDILHINKYYITQGVTKNMYQGWLARSEYLKSIDDYCKTLIGLRREEKLSQHDPKTLTHTLHLYSEEWKQANEDHARQKEKYRKNDGVTKVVFANFNQEQPKIEESDEK